jgi:hypothetical protein
VSPIVGATVSYQCRRLRPADALAARIPQVGAGDLDPRGVSPCGSRGRCSITIHLEPSNDIMDVSLLVFDGSVI